MQSLVPQLLHVIVGQTEQPMSTLSAGMGRPANWQIAAAQPER